MSNVRLSARTYRWLGCMALVHAAIPFGSAHLALSAAGTDNDWPAHLWVSVVTLWFLWPVALAIHRGRSLVRFGLFVCLGGVLLWPSLRFYDVLAPETFGLPPGVKMNPVSVWQFSGGYLTGRTQAKKDIAGGILAIEDAGLKPGYDRWDGPILRERFQIQIRTIETSTVGEKEFGHRDGYNSVSIQEIDRRFGWDRVQAARGEALKALSEPR